jgi:hypothetical protein
MNKKRLLELAGVEINEGKTFKSEGDMLRYVLEYIKNIRDDNLHPDVEVEDIFHDINDLLDIMKDASVKVR